jgi:hypothetical protein
VLDPLAALQGRGDVLRMAAGRTARRACTLEGAACGGSRRGGGALAAGRRRRAEGNWGRGLVAGAETLTS